MKPTLSNLEVKDDVPSERDQDVVVERRDGNTYYKIEHLHIHLTAEVIHQLNLNPDNVINTLKGELKSEFDKIAMAQFKPINKD